MKQKYFTQYIKPILADRPYLFLMTSVVLAGLLLMLYVIFMVQARDIQVVTQYSAFGESHFYKNKWFYLYAFAGFGFLVAIAHGALLAKLYKLNYRDVGIMLGFTSLILCIVAVKYAHEVMQLAFL